jgi:hypothetical protein
MNRDIHLEPTSALHDESRSTLDLVRDLLKEGQTLLQKELALARAEVSEKVSQVQSGVMELGAGAIVSFAGLLIVLHAAVYGLAGLFESGAGFGSLSLAGFSVGGVVLVVGRILLAKGRSNLKASNLQPDRTIESVQRDARVVRDRSQPMTSATGPGRT